VSTKPAWAAGKEVYDSAASKKRVSWWDYFNNEGRAEALLRKLKIRRRRADFKELWKLTREIIAQRWAFKSRQSRGRTERMVYVIATEPEQLKAFDSVFRLSGRAPACNWLLDLLIARDPAEEKQVSSQDNITAARIEGVKKAARRREARARTQLKVHLGKLRREQRLVKHWRSKVAYYDRKKGDG
jgi:hypothetical protein